MIKAFKFKLEAVLKVRRMEEDLCKTAVGKIQMQIENAEANIQEHKDAIDQSYQSQEQVLAKGTSGQDLRFHPYFTSTKNAHITQVKIEIDELKKELEQKFMELTQKRAAVKVLEKMREKEFKLYRKQRNKKQFTALEEQTQNWKAFSK